MLALFGFPTVNLVVGSFTSSKLTSPDASSFIGLANYAAAFASPQVSAAAGRTVLYAFVVVTCELVLGISIALLFDNFGERSVLFRTLFGLPLMISALVAGLLWKFLLSDNIGIVNWLLHWAGLLGDPAAVSWLSDTRIVIFSVMIADIWLTTSFVTLVIYAGLQSVPPELIDAARIDGATYIQRVRHVILPLLRPVIAVVLVIRGVDAAKTFDVIWIQTRGGPQFASEVLSLQIYRTTMQYGDVGQGSAIATLFLVVMLVVSTIAILRVWRPGEEAQLA